MNIEQTRAQVISSIWQAIAQSGVDLSSLPQEEQQKLVNTIANQLLLTVNGILDEVSAPDAPTEPANEFDEQELWKGRPFLSISETYLLTNERLRITKGLFGRDVENYELIRLQDINLSQGLSERLLNIGDIHLRGHDPSNPEVVLRNISKPEEVYEILRRAWLAARKSHGLLFREEM
jgi:hypothetical protein